MKNLLVTDILIYLIKQTERLYPKDGNYATYKYVLDKTQKCLRPIALDLPNYTIFKSKMILRRLGGGDEAHYRYVEEADNDANKNSALI